MKRKQITQLITLLTILQIVLIRLGIAQCDAPKAVTAEGCGPTEKIAHELQPRHWKQKFMNYCTSSDCKKNCQPIEKVVHFHLMAIVLK